MSGGRRLLAIVVGSASSDWVAARLLPAVQALGASVETVSVSDVETLLDRLADDVLPVVVKAPGEATE